MELKEQVASLELSKRMKELGFPQESLFYWENQVSKNIAPNLYGQNKNNKSNKKNSGKVSLLGRSGN